MEMVKGGAVKEGEMEWEWKWERGRRCNVKEREGSSGGVNNSTPR